MTSQLVEDRIRMDLLYRLRWNILADLHNIEIVVGPENEERIIPLFGHSSADADLGVPGLSRVEVNSGECLDKFELSYDGSPEPDGYRPPPSLIIENEDGGSITLRQFVTEVHAYLNMHLDEVKKALRGMYTTPADEMLFFFRRAWPIRTSDGNIRMSVELMPQAKQAYREVLWASQLNHARMYEQKRQSRQ